MDLQKSIHSRHDREITQRASDAMLCSSSVHHDVVPLRLDPINVFDRQAGKPAVDAGVEILLRYAFDHACLTKPRTLLSCGAAAFTNSWISSATVGALSRCLGR